MIFNKLTSPIGWNLVLAVVDVQVNSTREIIDDITVVLYYIYNFVHNAFSLLLYFYRRTNESPYLA